MRFPQQCCWGLLASNGMTEVCYFPTGEARERMKRSLSSGTCGGARRAEELRQAVNRNPFCVHLNARVGQEIKVCGADFAFRFDQTTVDAVRAYIMTGR